MTDINNGNSQYILQSVDNALRLIDILCEVEEIGVTELSREMGLGKSTAFRLLATLENRGYVRKDEENNKYRLGMKFAYVGTIVLNRMELAKYSRPYLEELTQRFNEASHLVTMEDDGYVRFLDKVRGSSFVHMESFVGGKKPSYCTGTGKVLLANMPIEKAKAHLLNQKMKAKTEKTITEINHMIEELEKIKLQGYAIDDEESELGLTCYAAPIYNASNEVIAAISLSGPTSRMKNKKEEMIPSVVETAKKISQSIK